MAKLVYAISGSSGLVGYALCEALIQQGHQVKRIVRHSSNRDNSEIHWDLQKQSIEIEKLSDVDCVVHLAGESIASGWWTASKKKAIAESRILRDRKSVV